MGVTEALDRLQVLSDTMRSFAEATFDLTALLDTIARRTAQAFRGFCAISLISADGQRLERAAAFGPEDIVARLVGQMPAGEPTIRALPTGESVLVVPLRVQGSTLGSLSVVSGGADAVAFDLADVAFAKHLAEHAALAVSNARAIAERRRTEQRLRLLSELAHEFSAATGNEQGLLELVARRLGEVVGECCNVRLIAADGEHFDPRTAIFDPDAERGRYLQEFIDSQPQGISEGLTGRAVTGKQAILLPQISEERLRAMIEPRFAPLIDRLGACSILVAPLLSRGQVIGVVALFRSQAGGAYDEEDQRMVEDLAAHAALAISTAKVLSADRAEIRERRHLADRLRVLTEASRDFAAATGNRSRLLELIARRACQAIGEASALFALDKDRTLRFGAFESAAPEHTTGMADRMRAFAERVVGTGRWLMQSDERSRQLLAVPLLAQNEVIGALTVTRADAAYDDDDLRRLEDLAAHASLALFNNELLESSKRELQERMRMEEVLRRGFLEAAPDAVLIANAEGQILLVNSQAEALFGYERSELVGQPIEKLVPERLRAVHPAHRLGYMTNLQTRAMGAGISLSAVRKDGGEFEAEISLSPIMTHEGPLVAAAVRDVSERRREMDERNRKVQEANRLKSEFLANMSHELRTPLNAIIGFAALMHAGKAGPMADVHKEYLGDILTSSRHLLQLINDVLDLSKIEAGRIELRVERVDLAQVVGEVRDILRGLAAEKRVRVELLLENAPPAVEVDARMLKQVLYNYLSNAIKFTPEEGRVALRIERSGDDAFSIEVEDTGIGIKPEDIERLFVEFQQLDSGAAKRYAGTGLGLALTKRIVEAQGGSVGVKSRLGQGSVFSATLPRVVRR
jgi:PAS domain S-box-containing protein